MTGIASRSSSSCSFAPFAARVRHIGSRLAGKGWVEEVATRSAQSFPSTASVVALPDITLRVRSRPGYETLKRTIDTLGALVLLIALLPAFLCIAVGVVVDSGWPIFYRGERIGRGARTFTVLSVRDMLRLDVEYADRSSLGLDLGILARTIPAVLRGTGAG